MSKLPITSYSDASDLMATCRSPAKGKPVSQGGRLFRDGDEFYLQYYGATVVRFYPDNTMTLHRPAGYKGRGGWSAFIGAATGLRAGSTGQRGETLIGRRFRWEQTGVEPINYHYTKVVEDPGHIFYEGMRIHMGTTELVGKPVKRMRKHAKTADNEKAKALKQALAEYQVAWKVAARLGTFDAPAADAAGRWHHRSTYGDAHRLLRIIQQCDLSPEAARYMIGAASACGFRLRAYDYTTQKWSNPAERLPDVVAHVYKSFTRALRLAAGATVEVEVEYKPRTQPEKVKEAA